MIKIGKPKPYFMDGILNPCCNFILKQIEMLFGV